jgi:hypothetical protein
MQAAFENQTSPPPAIHLNPFPISKSSYCSFDGRSDIKMQARGVFHDRESARKEEWCEPAIPFNQPG